MPMVLAMPVSVEELSRHSMRALDRKSVALDLPNGVAKLRREMRAQNEDAEIDAGRAASSRKGQ